MARWRLSVKDALGVKTVWTTALVVRQTISQTLTVILTGMRRTHDFYDALIGSYRYTFPSDEADQKMVGDLFPKQGELKQDLMDDEEDVNTEPQDAPQASVDLKGPTEPVGDDEYEFVFIRVDTEQWNIPMSKADRRDLRNYIQLLSVPVCHNDA